MGRARARSPQFKVIRYIYLPILATHSPPSARGYVQYGAGTMGSISCIAAPGVRCAPTTFTAGCRQRPAVALDATVSSFTPSAYTGIRERTPR
jgi:hypothetical protein